jgi:MFS family permease
MGGHLHAASHDRISHRGTSVGLAVRPVRGALVRHRRHGHRCGSFVWLALIPVNFSYWEFAAVLLLNGIGTGLFAAPNRADIMNSLPPNRRGVGAGMSTTFQNAAMVLSIGIFFSLMISGLARSLPHTLADGLIAQGVPAADATRVAALPPVSVLFASLLGYNPVQTCSGSAC